MVDREKVRKAFENPAEFTTSPLYRALSRTVAASDQLLDLASRGRPGQYPTFLFFGAVHLLLLRGADHPLARVRAGDAIDVLPRIGRELPAGEARVVYHSATRLHVPRDRRAAFDAAISSLNDTGPLW